MENGPFEDVFPIKNGNIPASYVSLPEGTIFPLYTNGLKFVFRCIKNRMSGFFLRPFFLMEIFTLRFYSPLRNSPEVGDVPPETW